MGIGGVSGSNVANMNSIYGNRNVISGLASGMDTESMIKNAVSGIEARITALGKKRTTAEWKQAGYQSVIDKMVDITNKYTSYTSSTNLFSASFFNKAVSTSASGVNGSKVSATGKSTSEVLINAVKQLATAARSVSTSGALNENRPNLPTVSAGEGVNLDGVTEVSTMSGTMTLNYGNKTVDLSFGEMENYKSAEELANAIAEKLKDQKIVLSSGDTKAASDLIGVTLNKDTGEIGFFDKSSAKNSVSIGGATGDLKRTLGLENAYTDKPKSFTVSDDLAAALTQKKPTGEYLSEKTMTFNLDGTTKKIQLPKYGENGVDTAKKYMEELQKTLDTTFGRDKIKVSNIAADKDTVPGSLQLQFEVQNKGSTLSVSGDAGKVLGLGNTASSYLEMGTTLGQVKDAFAGLTGEKIAASGDASKFKQVGDTDVYLDEKGNRVKKGDDNQYYRLAKGSDDEFLQEYEFKINGETIGKYTQDTALDTVISNINNNTKAGVNVAFSKTTGNFTFTAKETGAANGIKIEGGLAENLFGKIDDVRGTDAVFNVSINGDDYAMTRSSNTFDIDGLSITLKDSFNAGSLKANGELDSSAPIAAENKVTFTTKSDADKIVSAVKNMFDDYNTMMKEIKKQYTTIPAQKSNGVKYAPLSEDDKSGMSEDAIKAYEDKAREGVLFGDGDLSSLYGKMRDIFNPTGNEGAYLRSIGITTEYSATDGTTVVLDEEKLRAALEKNPDAVKDAFTKSKDNGAATDGIMASMKTQLDNYASVTGATKGLLVEKAGSKYAPTSLLKNTMKDITDGIDKEIERWTTKLSDQVDRYTRKFSQLEQLVAQMNSQSSSLMGMMGGNS